MRFRPVFLPLPLLAASLALSSFQVVQAADPPARNPFLDPPAPEGPREGGPRLEGGPRPEGAAPRPGPGGPGGQRPDETPEQFRERVLAPYVEMVPDLTEEQKTHIMAILDAVNLESAAIRANTTLPELRQRAAGRAVRADIPNRIKSALTDEQLVPYNELLAEQAAAIEEMNKISDAHVEEGIDEKRERIVKGYEEFLEEVSVKQKTEIIKILEAADTQSAAIKADTTKTAAQKSAALLQIHSSLTTRISRISPLLDAEQRVTWKKAHDAKRPQ